MICRCNVLNTSNGSSPTTLPARQLSESLALGATPSTQFLINCLQRSAQGHVRSKCLQFSNISNLTLSSNHWNNPLPCKDLCLLRVYYRICVLAWISTLRIGSLQPASKLPEKRLRWNFLFGQSQAPWSCNSAVPRQQGLPAHHSCASPSTRLSDRIPGHRIGPDISCSWPLG